MADAWDEAERFEITTGDLTFRAVAAGPKDGRLVILLHGFPETSRSWRGVLPALGAAGYRALAFDQRGYSPGARPAAVEDYRTDELVADVLAVADSQSADSFDLVGHDWGGMVAWIVGGTAQSRVRTLTAVSTPHPGAFAAALMGGDSEQAEKSGYIAVFQAEGGVAENLLLGADNSGDGLRAMFAASGMEPGDASEFVEAMRQPGALTAALNWYRAMSVESIAGIGPITSPTMYVWSTEDIALGRGAAEATKDFVEGPYRFEVLEGVSHWIPEMASSDLGALLLDHLAANP